MLRIWTYRNCTTCRRAATWMRDRGFEFEERDILAPPSAEELARLHAMSGVPLQKLFNTSGEHYRAEKVAEKLAVWSEAEAYEALAANGKLIKRPILETEARAAFGFNEAVWTELTG